MAEEVFIPKFGQTVEEVTIVKFYARDGERVEAGQPLLDVETDKAIFTVEASASGYLHLGPIKEGDVVPVVSVIGLIGEKDDTFTAQAGPAPSPGPGEEVAAGPEGAPEEVSLAAGETSAGEGLASEGGRRFASPRARRLAGERKVDLSRVAASGGGGIRIVERDVLAYLGRLPRATPVAAKMAASSGLDLAGIPGTGTRGAITKSDVEKALEGKPPAAARPPAPPTAVPLTEAEIAERVPLSGVRAVIFERMAASAHTTARVTLTTEADATELVAARERLKESVSEAWGFAPGYNDLLGLIVARALREFPSMNARLSADGKAIEWLASINLGMAVETERGLLVPVIRQADRLGLREFGAEFRRLAERARAGRALPEDLGGGTFTITNLGMYEIDAFTPVINLPEAAILGVGRIQGKVVPYRGEIAVRQALTLSLAFDHRLNDGAPAARFLQRIKQIVENPLLLLG